MSLCQTWAFFCVRQADIHFIFVLVNSENIGDAIQILFEFFRHKISDKFLSYPLYQHISLDILIKMKIHFGGGTNHVDKNISKYHFS